MRDEQNRELNWRALFADETSDYRRPEEPDEGDRVLIRFRTAKDNADAVFYIEEERKMYQEITKILSFYVTLPKISWINKKNMI